MENQVAVWYVQEMGSSRFLPILKASEDLFILAGFVPGMENVGADALWCDKTSLVEWRLSMACFRDLTDLYGPVCSLQQSSVASIPDTDTQYTSQGPRCRVFYRCD